MRIINDLSRGRVETFTFLDAIAGNINTGSNDTLWPLISGSYESGVVLPAYAASRPLTVSGGEAEVERIGGLCPRVKLGSGGVYLAGTDTTAYEFGDGSSDSAFSVGLWVKQPVAAVATLISKYDAAGTDREWRLALDAAGDINFELYDESATASEIANAATVYTADEWHCIIATYDGDQTTPVVNIYLDAVAQTNGATTESGTYVAMEAGDTPLLVGADGTGGALTNPLIGEVALPFVTDVELTAAQVADIYHNSGALLGMFERTP